GHHAQQGGLAAARRPHQHHQLAVGDVETGPVHGDLAVVVDLAHSVEPHVRHRLPHSTDRANGDRRSGTRQPPPSPPGPSLPITNTVETFCHAIVFPWHHQRPAVSATEARASPLPRAREGPAGIGPAPPFSRRAQAPAQAAEPSTERQPEHSEGRLTTMSPEHETRAMHDTLLLFGATGDLAQRYLFPSLLRLLGDGLLPEDFRVRAMALSPHDTEKFHDIL